MAAYNDTLTRLCGRQETIKEGRELLNIARAKTGPGSGHFLGAGAVGLPAICALLASERLGNNDVVEKVAQETSCLQPKQFKASLNTVRSALASYLKKKVQQSISYPVLCRNYGLNDDALYWMEEVEKELRKANVLDDLDVADETVTCMVFYWTCIALNIRSVKRAAIMADHSVNLRDFQALERALDNTCQNVRESIDKFISENRTARSGRSSPAKASVSPTKTPTRASATTRTFPTDGSPLKRKATLPPLPPSSPVKRPRIASPTKLNRLPVTSSFTSQSGGASTPTTRSPVKTYSASRSFREMPTDSSVRPDETSASPSKRAEVLPGTPVTPIKGSNSRTKLLTNPGEARSPMKRPLSEGSPVTDPLTPTPRRIRGRPARPPLPSLMQERAETGDTQDIDAEPEESSDEDGSPPPCRHRLSAFSDRSFYRYRDPRVLREWEVCERSLKAMIEKYGNPLDEVEV
ncbi:hypothetical protein M0805_002706 [Coniferiporia weirii]|nr:hypothetical protein M0805_002706 [Coniferiporia weirii]